MLQENLSHFLLGLDIVGLIGCNISEHTQRQLGVTSEQSQVSIGDSDTELLGCS